MVGKSLSEDVTTDDTDGSLAFLNFKDKVKEVLDLVRNIPNEHKAAAREYITENYFEILKLLDEDPTPSPGDHNNIVNSNTVSARPPCSLHTIVMGSSVRAGSAPLQHGKRWKREKTVLEKANPSVNTVDNYPSSLELDTDTDKQQIMSEHIPDRFPDTEKDTVIITPLSKMFDESILYTNKAGCPITDEGVDVKRDLPQAVLNTGVDDEHVNAEMDQDALMDEIDNMKPESNIPYIKEGTPETVMDDVSDVSSLLSFLPQLSPYIKFDMKDRYISDSDKEGYLHLMVERSDGSVHNLKIGGVTAASPEELRQYDKQHVVNENRADKQINLIQEQLNNIEKENDPFLDETDSEMFSEPRKKSRGRPRKTPMYLPSLDDEGREVFTCHVCQTTVQTQHAMKVHMRSHTGVKPFSCRFCGKSFTTKGNMKQHEATHNEEKPWQCMHCDKAFKDKKILTVHKRCHTGERPYKCHLCEKAFSQNGVLKEHLLIHTGQKPHLCDLCGQEFRGLSSLRAHRLRHLNKRDFKCDKCNKEFICKNDLSRHYMTHTGARPFICSLCPKRFTRLNYLKEHMNVHNGSKPFACQECNNTFADSMSLHRHKKKHKSDKDENSKQNYQSELDKDLSSGYQSVADDNLPTIEITEQTAFGQQTSVQVVLDENTTMEEFQRFHSLVLSAANSADFTLTSQDAAKQIFQVMCVNPDTQEIVDQGQGHQVICEGHSSDFAAINMLANATAQQYTTQI